MSIHTISPDAMPLTHCVADTLFKHFPDLDVYVVQDIPGEDHVYAQHTGEPTFDLLVTTARKFVFLWYYAMPPRVVDDRGVLLMDDLKKLAIGQDYDLVIKYAQTRQRPHMPAMIIRQGKKATMGTGDYASIMVHPAYQKFVIKRGNPQLEGKQQSEEYLRTYRNQDWVIPNVFERLSDRTFGLVKDSLKRHGRSHMEEDLRGGILYAGCAFHYVYPKLGFGMRDVDVNVFFAPRTYSEGLRSSRGVLARNCGIEEFGKPSYFGYKTRILDVMWNILHQDTGDAHKDILAYVGEMRFTSDRWSTASQRPILDLQTGELLYVPAWLQRLEQHPDGAGIAQRRPGLRSPVWTTP